MTTHYDHDGQAACVARIKVPWLTGDARTADCENCRRTGAYQRAVTTSLPPVDSLYDGPADPADAELIREWIERLAG